MSLWERKKIRVDAVGDNCKVESVFKLVGGHSVPEALGQSSVDDEGPGYEVLTHPVEIIGFGSVKYASTRKNNRSREDLLQCITGQSYLNN